MALFLGVIAFLFAITIIAKSCKSWHQARQEKCVCLKIGAALMFIGGVVALFVVLFYGIRYHASGDFERAALSAAAPGGAATISPPRPGMMPDPLKQEELRRRFLEQQQQQRRERDAAPKESR